MTQNLEPVDFGQQEAIAKTLACKKNEKGLAVAMRRRSDINRQLGILEAQKEILEKKIAAANKAKEDIDFKVSEMNCFDESASKTKTKTFTPKKSSRSKSSQL